MECQRENCATYLFDQLLKMTSVQKDIQAQFRYSAVLYIILTLEHIGM